MSHNERLVQLASAVPEDLASFAFFLLKHYLDAAEEAADNAFCKALIEEALAEPGEEEWVDFEDACEMLGVKLN